MLFAQKVLAPRPRLKHPEMSNVGGRPAEPEVYPKEIIFLRGICGLGERYYLRWCKFGAALKLRPFSVSARAVRFTESCLSR